MTGTHAILLALPLALFAATFAAWLRGRGVRPVAAEIDQTRRADGGFPSDHYPVRADFALPRTAD